MTKWFANAFRKEGLREGLQTPPTYLQSKLTSNLDHYGKKASMKRAYHKKGRAETTLPLKIVLVG